MKGCIGSVGDYDTFLALYCRCSTELGPHKWDVTTIDKLMYILLPMLLSKSAFILMFIMSPLEPPTLTIQCWYPADFTAAWEKYGESECLSKGESGQLYAWTTEEIPDQSQPRKVSY